MFFYGQDALKPRYQDFVKGDIYFVANTIVNRVEKDKNSNEPYNVVDRTSKSNDELNMRYIDIDDDVSTFSSSSAELKLNSYNYVVKFAGLYWSATYTYDEIERKVKKNRFVYKIVNENRTDFSSVKLKLPNTENYIDIKGEVLFDGFKEEEYQSNSPYVVFADVTDLLTSQKDISGNYTVANIKASQGFIEGGVSGGWSLFVVIEDLNQAETKQITLLDGFISIYKEPHYFIIDNFKTPKEGSIETQIAMASLEGDFSLKGDDVSLKTDLDERFYTLTNTVKQKGNFFNSSIINGEQENLSRVPNSKNNLGFDVMLIPYKNEFNKSIPNDASKLTLKLASKNDRTYLYFLGFSVNSINVKQPLVSGIETIGKQKSDTVLKNTETVNNKEKSLNSVEKPNKMNTEAVLSKSEKVEYINKAEKQETKPYKSDDGVAYSNAVKTFLAKNKIENQNIPNVKKSYYLVANVYSSEFYCNHFLKKLQDEGLPAKMFFNPENQYKYVYLYETTDIETIVALYNSKFNNLYSDALWVKAVNMPE